MALVPQHCTVVLHAVDAVRFMAPGCLECLLRLIQANENKLVIVLRNDDKWRDTNIVVVGQLVISAAHLGLDPPRVHVTFGKSLKQRDGPLTIVGC